VLTYAVHVSLELIGRLVPERRCPVVDEEGVYDGTSTDMSGHRAWTSNADWRLNGMCHKLDVFPSAVWSVDILHNYESDGPGSADNRESAVDPRNPHGAV